MLASFDVEMQAKFLFYLVLSYQPTLINRLTLLSKQDADSFHACRNAFKLFNLFWFESVFSFFYLVLCNYCIPFFLGALLQRF